MLALTSSVWDIIFPPLVAGTGLFGMLVLFILAQKLKKPSFLILAFFSGMMMVYSIGETLIHYFDSIHIHAEAAQIVGLVQLLCLLPALWALPAYLERSVLPGSRIAVLARGFSYGGVVFALLGFVVAFIRPEWIIRYSLNGVGSLGPLMISVTVWLQAFLIATVAQAFILRSKDPWSIELKRYLWSLGVVIPFIVLEVVISIRGGRFIPPFLLHYTRLIMGFFIMDVVIIINCLRFAISKASREETAVTAAEAHKLALEQHIWYDPLTGLPNRRRFREHLDGDLSIRNPADKSRLALLLLDIDDFRSFNDTFGHGPGDDLLKEAASRMTTALRDGDQLFRLGGDEFAVILPQAKDTEEASVVANRLIEVFGEPVYTAKDRPVFTSLSVGIAFWPYDGTSTKDLYRHADAALHRAKKHRNAFRTYSPDMSKEAAERLEMIHILKKALNDDEFTLNYQPVLHRDGHVVGAEALLRLTGENGGIMPDRFIPVAESTGLIAPIGDRVVMQALADRASMTSMGPDFYISVNLSVKQLRDPTLVKRINDSIVINGLSPAAVRFEITESSLMENFREVLPSIRSFRDLGYKLSLDDFGTGYSSLGYLLELPIDVLKLDKAFLNGLNTGAQGRTIVHSLITLAKGLGLEVVVEGIETTGHRDYLSTFEGVYQQGFLHGRPMDLPSFRRLFIDVEEGETNHD